MDRPTWWEYIRTRGLWLVAIILGLAVLMSEGAEAWHESKQWWLGQQSTSDWFEYHGVDFVVELPNARAGLGALQMRSTVTVHRTLDLAFEDSLRCSAEGADVFEFISQNDPSSVRVEPHPSQSSLWRYNAGYPTDPDAMCSVQSTIRATWDGVTKTLVVNTPLFNPSG